MNRAVHTFFVVVALTFSGMGLARAQSAPQTVRLTPPQRQQLSRDLVPSSAQDFFKTGQVTLEQEVRRLTRQRSPLNKPLLTVQDALPKQNEPMVQPPLPPNQAKEAPQ